MPSNTSAGSAIVLFRLNGCGHCEALKPTWEKVKKELTKKHISFKEYEYSSMPNEYRDLISGFPSIQVIKNHKFTHEYSGDRSFDSIVSFAIEYVPPVKTNTLLTTLPSKKPITKDKKKVDKK